MPHFDKSDFAGLEDRLTPMMGPSPLRGKAPARTEDPPVEPIPDGNQSAPETQPLLPLKFPGKRVLKSQRMDSTEDAVMSEIVQGLRWDGWEVLVTSRRRHRPRCPFCFKFLDYCRQCGRSLLVEVLDAQGRIRRRLSWPVQTEGCDEGVPDLLVRWTAVDALGQPLRDKWQGDIPWPACIWFGAEVKGSRTPYSNDTQKRLAEGRHYALWKSLPQAREELRAFHDLVRPENNNPGEQDPIVDPEVGT